MLLKYIPQVRMMGDDETDEYDLHYSLNFWNDTFMGLDVNFTQPYEVSKGLYKDLIKIYVT